MCCMQACHRDYVRTGTADELSRRSDLQLPLTIDMKDEMHVCRFPVSPRAHCNTQGHHSGSLVNSHTILLCLHSMHNTTSHLASPLLPLLLHNSTRPTHPKFRVGAYSRNWLAISSLSDRIDLLLIPSHPASVPNNTAHIAFACSPFTHGLLP